MGRPISGSPFHVGAGVGSIFPHTGPTSYVQITYGPLANGDTVNAVEAGMKSFDFLHGNATDSGNFALRMYPTVPSTQFGNSASTYRVMWIATRTATIGGQAQTAGSEAVAGTNLSAEVARIMAFGKT